MKWVAANGAAINKYISIGIYISIYIYTYIPARR